MRVTAGVRLVWLTVCCSLAAGCGGGGPTSTAAVTSSIPFTAPTGSVAAPPAGSASSPVPGGEMPSQADAFVDSIGVNVHLTYTDTAYGAFASVQSLIGALGVRHVRDGGIAGDGTILAKFRALAAAGTKLDFLTTAETDVATLAAWASALTGTADAFEGPNELDLSNTPSWASVLDAFQASIYPVLGGSGRIVIGPTVSSAGAMGQAGPFTTDADDGNMHDYFAGRNPGNGGFGNSDAFGVYGSLTWNLGIASQMTPGKPMMSTETGYSEAVDQNAVPATVKAHYVVRTLLEHWNAHVVRTYLYELLDEGGTPFSHYGLADASGNPKPAFVALKALIAHLADPGPPFTTAPLAYVLTGGVHHTLLERRNGSYALIVWTEASEYDVAGGAATPLTPQAVTVTFPSVPRTLAVTTFGPGGNASTTTPPSGSTLSLAVDGSPTIVDITP